ncbi:hypothetical protein LguiB_020874 [Lonicera macranthoides]
MSEIPCENPCTPDQTKTQKARISIKRGKEYRCADEVLAGAVKHLVKLIDPAAGMIYKAVAVLSNLTTIPEGRPAIGQEGAIPVLVEVV